MTRLRRRLLELLYEEDVQCDRGIEFLADAIKDILEEEMRIEYEEDSR